MSHDYADFFQLGRGISLIMGVHLQIQIEGVDHQLKGFIVGVEPGEYLIVRIPDVKYLKLAPGRRVVLLFLYRGQIFRSESQLIGSTSAPLVLLFVKYPEKIENFERRSTKRVDCFVPTTIRYDGKEHYGVIRNISEGGCRVVIRVASALKDEKLSGLGIDDKVTLTFQLPDAQEEMTVLASVRNMQSDSQGMSLGIQWHDIPRDLRSRIAQFIATFELF